MTSTEQKTPLGGSEAGGADGLYAVLPLRDIVVFPHMIVPLFVGREADPACHPEERRR